MTETRISDIIVPAVFTAYVQERTATLSALSRSGIVRPNPVINALVQQGGKLIQMPEFTDLGDGESEVLSDQNPLSVDNIGTQQMDAPLIARGKAWGTNEISAELAGSDPQMAIGNSVARYWARDRQRTLVNVLAGVFDGALASTHRFDAFSETGASPADDLKLNEDNVVSSLELLGDQLDAIAAMAMHSMPYYNLVRRKLIDFVAVQDDGTVVHQGADGDRAEGENRVPFFLGKRVIVDDGCRRRVGTTSGYVYHTYLFGYGSIGEGTAPGKTPSETDRDSLAGVDILVNRQHYVIHPSGVSYSPTAGTGQAGPTPTNAELADSSKWTRVHEVKNIKMLEIRTNG